MYRRNVTCQFASVLLAVCALVSGISAQHHGDRSNPEKVNAPALSQVTALRAIVGAGRLEDLRWPNFPDYRVQLRLLPEFGVFTGLGASRTAYVAGRRDDRDIAARQSARAPR